MPILRELNAPTTVWSFNYKGHVSLSPSNSELCATQKTASLTKLLKYLVCSQVERRVTPRAICYNVGMTLCIEQQKCITSSCKKIHKISWRLVIHLDMDGVGIFLWCGSATFFHNHQDFKVVDRKTWGEPSVVILGAFPNVAAQIEMSPRICTHNEPVT